MEVLFNNYRHLGLSFTSGSGCYLVDEKNTKYLDFTAGLAVTGLGHCHPQVVEALQRQAGKLWHTSNLFAIPQQQEVARQLLGLSKLINCRVFFCNSGAEAMEAAIKLTRRYHFDNGQKDRNHIITLQGAFHGRTLATIYAAANPTYCDGFAPAIPGFISVDDLTSDTISSVLSEARVAGIMLEIIQGEGGVKPLELSTIRRIRRLCDQHQVLMIVDEIQTGCGRTGKMWAHHHASIRPDIIACAKGIANGFPAAALIADAKIAASFKPGLHGTTFGGNPLAMAAAQATLKVIAHPGFLTKVTESGARLGSGLDHIQRQHQEKVRQVRGWGLMRGIELSSNIVARDFAVQCQEKQLLLAPAGSNTIRLLPPLVVSASEIDTAIDIIDQQLAKL